eukprot:768119-Hanusia_phi.AAC.2
MEHKHGAQARAGVDRCVDSLVSPPARHHVTGSEEEDETRGRRRRMPTSFHPLPATSDDKFRSSRSPMHYFTLFLLLLLLLLLLTAATDRLSD